MAGFSRRALAAYAVDQLLASAPIRRLSQQLAAALIVSNKQKEAELLERDIAAELENRGLAALAIVTSANKLSAHFKMQLAEQIKKATGVERVTMDEKIDPSVLGGIRIETANHRWDRTVTRQLSDIKGGI